MDLNIEDFASNLMENGYSIKTIPNMVPIDNLRSNLSKWLREKFFLTLPDEELLNNIHIAASINSEDTANTLTIDSIKHLSQTLSFDEIIYSSCKPYLNTLFGLDIHSQKGNNIVVQHPNSTRVAELHIDAPPTSPFEVVCWVPLVNCFKSKSFYIVNKKDTIILMEKYRGNSYQTWDHFKEDALRYVKNVEVSYGQVLFFSSCLLHGSHINETNETRWCINTRFKSLFAPSGMHDVMTYYRVLSIGPLTDIGLKLK